MRFPLIMHDIIKIPHKKFEDLSLEEVGLMVEADSSISPNGNECFAACALDEFLYSAELKNRPDLEKIRTEILDNIYLDAKGSDYKEINTRYLKELANNLKSK